MHTARSRLAYSYREVAGLLGVSVRTIERRCADGMFHPVHLGGRLRRIPADQVHQVLGAGAATGHADPAADAIAREMLERR